MTINDVQFGSMAKILRHNADGAIRQRLCDLGLLPKAEVEIVRSAPLGDPIQLRVNGNDVSLRRSEAMLIEVE